MEKIKATSCVGLAHLAMDFRRFDFIYVDGSHHSADVYIDDGASWPMLVSGGVMIFDDYEWSMMQTEAERPKLGVDHRRYQIIIERN